MEQPCCQKHVLPENRTMKWMLFCLTCVALASCSGEEDVPLRGGDWIVDYYEVGGERFTTSTNYILSFTDGEYTFKMNTNTCFGTFSETESGTISLNSPTCTEACCDSDEALKALELIKSAETYELDNIELVLDGPDGVVLLFAN